MEGFIQETKSSINLGVCGNSNYCAYIENFTNCEVEEIGQLCTNSNNSVEHTGWLYKITENINTKSHNKVIFKKTFIKMKKITGKAKYNPTEVIVNKQDRTIFLNPNHKQGSAHEFQEAVERIRNSKIISLKDLEVLNGRK